MYKMSQNKDIKVNAVVTDILEVTLENGKTIPEINGFKVIFRTNELVECDLLTNIQAEPIRVVLKHIDLEMLSEDMDK